MIFKIIFDSCGDHHQSVEFSNTTDIGVVTCSTCSRTLPYFTRESDLGELQCHLARVQSKAEELNAKVAFYTHLINTQGE